MLDQLSWKVGGQQGEGVESTGETFAVALNRQGYYVYSFRHFSSRIKGGHSNDKVRVSLKRFRASNDYTDVLLAFDQESIDLNVGEVRQGGIVIADEKFKPTAPDHVRLFVVPLTKIAEESGSAIMKNMVSLGASACALGLPVDIFTEVIEERFRRKGQKVVDQNMEAIQRGYDYMKDLGGADPELALKPADGTRRYFMMGNDALGLGALAAGVRVMPAYPITPASDVMEYLIKKLPKVGGVVVQTEDEIAAMTMTIGANYGGARALTCTSGPGLSLMMEAIGLSGMTETPTVIIDTQRGGPSTGLPTKQEQSDYLAALFGTHGEIPKIVLTPATPEECFYVVGDAFNLAEQYQCPVIIMTDLQLSLSKQSTDALDNKAVKIDRGLIATSEEAAANQASGEFKRYAFTESGVSPRIFPGTPGGIHKVTGNEHFENGRPAEPAGNRQKMMDKRLGKLAHVELEGSVVRTGDENPDVVIVGIGANVGAITEASEMLRADGYKVAHAQLHAILPFPVQMLQDAIHDGKKVVVVENNATGQIKHLMNFFGVSHPDVQSLLKYDGQPFLPSEIHAKIKGMF
ncbi:2-oxoacid:acceptor oxidoreductase subunit alpha [Alicyclobacillus ferrooxydans]|uniref:2-oxoglutarate ferredoxin oxidoreductase subunit alpha n=1 Tax=Alicyclobacillus ferrooxydans TaxID=471514 RepID=A0A0P9F195_9BACL|nr:2-oxoacid:acceptor oxidoreductase subunit alpha [Alicyclobacillus ferrooxydans]KPV45137.1 2-oxoglutarate ferredoxin oxidoreductase subunit alpha [Alicyclobacillus ferrooxydans]